MSDSPLILSATDVSVRVAGAGGDAGLVERASFTLRRSEVLGIVGESGSGKSLTALALLGLASANLRVSGQLLFDGEGYDLSSPQSLKPLRGPRIGMIFQDPRLSLNPVRSIGSHFRELRPGARSNALGLSRDDAAGLLASVGVPDPAKRLKQYPHELSGGLSQRVMIALALATAPDLLIADEPTTALDTTVQAQILDLIDELRTKRGMSVILISHDLAVVSELADRVAVMRRGQVLESGRTQTIFENARNDYTRRLVSLASDTAVLVEQGR